MARIIASMTALLVCTWALPAAALPTAEDLLTQVGFSADAKQQVLDGKFVTTGLEPTSERELAMAMAFLVSEPPAELIEDAKKDLVAGVDPGYHRPRHGLSSWKPRRLQGCVVRIRREEASKSLLGSRAR